MTDFEMFQQWLEDHNYCKVVRCSQCHFWHDKQDPEHSYPEATAADTRLKHIMMITAAMQWRLENEF